MEPVIVEILDGHGSVLRRERVVEVPFELGRGYSCEVIVDDPHLCARHLRVERVDGALTVRDVSEVNGVTDGEGLRIESAVVGDDLELRAGTTRIRLRTGGVAVPAALPLPALPARRRSGDWQVALIALAAFVGLAAALEYFGGVEKRTTSEFLQGMLYWPPLLGLWSGAWAFAGRALLGRARWAMHLAITCTWGAAMIVVGVGAGWLAFWLGVDHDPEWWISALLTLVFGVGLHSHLSLTSRKPPRWRWSIAAVGVAGILGIQAITTLAARDDFWAIPKYTPSVKPIPAAWLPTSDFESFLADSGELRRQADAEAAEAAEKGD